MADLERAGTYCASALSKNDASVEYVVHFVQRFILPGANAGVGIEAFLEIIFFLKAALAFCSLRGDCWHA